MISNSGVHLVSDGNGGFRLDFDDTRIGRAKKRYVAAVGEKTRQTFIAVNDSNNNRQFVPDKKIDQYARIQSFKDQCLIENIMRRCLNGDPSALNVRQGFYGDVSAFPRDLRGMYGVMEHAKEVFEGLSNEVKNDEFKGSFELFLDSFGDPANLERFMARYVAPKVPEVKEDALMARMILRALHRILPMLQLNVLRSTVTPIIRRRLTAVNLFLSTLTRFCQVIRLTCPPMLYSGWQLLCALSWIIATSIISIFTAPRVCCGPTSRSFTAHLIAHGHSLLSMRSAT